MTPRDTLLSLADRCEKAEGADREIDTEIAGLLHWDNPITFADDERLLPYTASLDAAMGLVPEGASRTIVCLPTGRATGSVLNHRFRDGQWWFNRSFGEGRGDANTPALALTAAALRARSAMESGYD